MRFSKIESYLLTVRFNPINGQYEFAVVQDADTTYFHKNIEQAICFPEYQQIVQRSFLDANLHDNLAEDFTIHIYFNEDDCKVGDVECFYKGSICANDQNIIDYCSDMAKFIIRSLPMYKNEYSKG